MPYPFVPGWSYEIAEAANARYAAAGITFRSLSGKAASKPAYSLSKFRRRHLEQGSAGTCWLHAGVFAAETIANARNLDGFDVCRMLVGWQGKRLEGGGNPTNGGDPTDSLLAMTADKGVGIAPEALWPYSDSARALAQSPSAAVIAAARPFRMSDPFDVADLDSAKAVIDEQDTPCVLGMWWPYGWDDHQSVMTGIGCGQYGHAPDLIGHADAGILDAQECFQVENWHGLIYPPLSPELAAKIPGYVPATPTATSDFWVTRSALSTVLGYRGGMIRAATDLTGYKALFDLADAAILSGF